MTEPRVIRKYPNRRLYDTAESRYIRLADIRELVLCDIAFVVVDKASGNDITRSILLQVIADEEQRREPIMTRAFLAQVIRAHGYVPPSGVAGYLEQCLDTYLTRGRPVVPVRRGRFSTVQDGGALRAESDSDATAARRENVRFGKDRKKAG